MDRSERSTEAVPEVPVHLRVNGDTVAHWTCSPVAPEALGAGRLASMGYLRTPGDLADIVVRTLEHGVLRIDARVSERGVAAALDEREHRRSHGCGILFLRDCRPDLMRTRSDARVPGPDLFPDLFRQLYERSPTRRTTGGHHTVALSDGAGLFHVHEEVGRHNGADKAIGGCLLAGGDATHLGIITTARISAEIAEKSARAGLAWIASRSVPTTMAVEIAAAAGMAIVARAAGKEARVFHG